MKWKRLKKKYLRYITPYWIKNDIIVERFKKYCRIYDKKYVEIKIGDIKTKEELSDSLNELERLDRVIDRIWKLLRT